jgi:hypothetical protein
MPTYTQGILDERARCLSICEGWLAHFAGRQPIAISAQDWANDAVKDIGDAIRSGVRAAREDQE